MPQLLLEAVLMDMSRTKIIEDPAGIGSEQYGQDKNSRQIKNNKDQSRPGHYPSYRLSVISEVF